MEEWLKFLKILVAESDIIIEENDNSGQARALLAKSIMDVDERIYKQEIDLNKKLTDDFVDCSEFVHEVIEQSDSFLLPWDCDSQYLWFTENEGEYGDDWEDIEIGDIIFWVKPSDTGDLTHTGIVYELRADGTATIIHATCQGDCSGKATKASISTVSTSSDGDLWVSGSSRRNFRYWARKNN